MCGVRLNVAKLLVYTDKPIEWSPGDSCVASLFWDPNPTPNALAIRRPSASNKYEHCHTKMLEYMYVY